MTDQHPRTFLKHIMHERLEAVEVCHGLLQRTSFMVSLKSLLMDLQNYEENEGHSRIQSPGSPEQ